MPVAPPRPKDLPLTALRAFEAAARLGGFAAAAQELGVTPGAITAHVKQLESALGARPVRPHPAWRAPHGTGPAIAARPDGSLRCAGHRHRRLARRRRAPHRAYRHAARHRPTVALARASPPCAPPRRISASPSPRWKPRPNLKRSPYDLSLFFSDDRQGRIAPDVIFPVCAPALAATLRSPADIARHPCLSDATWHDDWSLWSSTLADPPFPARWPGLFALRAGGRGNGQRRGHPDRPSGAGGTPPRRWSPRRTLCAARHPATRAAALVRTAPASRHTRPLCGRLAAPRPLGIPARPRYHTLISVQAHHAPAAPPLQPAPDRCGADDRRDDAAALSGRGGEVPRSTRHAGDADRLGAHGLRRASDLAVRAAPRRPRRHPA